MVVDNLSPNEFLRVQGRHLARMRRDANWLTCGEFYARYGLPAPKARVKIKRLLEIGDAPETREESGELIRLLAGSIARAELADKEPTR